MVLPCPHILQFGRWLVRLSNRQTDNTRRTRSMVTMTGTPNSRKAMSEFSAETGTRFIYHLIALMCKILHVMINFSGKIFDCWRSGKIVSRHHLDLNLSLWHLHRL